jgi:hypothetical protein
MSRILHHAEQEGSRTVALSFQLANKRIFTNSDTFLQWFCACIGQELGMLDQLVKCWQLADIIGSNQCCKAYFEQYLLSETSASLTLGLDEVDRVFDSPEIADDFFGLLRALHEEAKRRDIWKKFRLVVVHSTEVYIPLDVNKSPFNVGLPVELPEFTREQIEDLAKRYQSTLSSSELKEIMDLLGGHPYLIQMALYHISYRQISVEEFLATSVGDRSIYRDHLLNHADNLKKNPKLFEALKAAFKTNKPMNFSEEDRYKLQSLGLIKEINRQFFPRCDLYRQYFSK